MKTKIKKQWTQVVAVAAAAVCAVTATCAGVTFNHAAPMDAYALEAGDEVKVTVVDGTDDSGNPTRNFKIAASQFSATDVGKTVYLTFETSTEYAGDSFKGGGGYWDNAASEWIPFDDWQGVVEEDGTIVIGVEVLEGMLTYDGVVQMHGIIPAEGGWENAGGTLLTFIAAAFEQPYIEETTTTETTTTTTETTTTTTTTDTTESSEDTTTTTTVTESSESSEDTTTTTTVTESSESSEDTTTTTTESTTKSTTTTTTTTTPKATTTTTTTSVTLETSIDFTQEKGDDGDGDYNAFVEFDPMGADKVRIVFKVSSSDTQATVSYGCWNNADSKWYDDENLVAIPTDKIVSYTDVVPAKVESTMKISIYYPKAAYVTIQDVVLIYDEAPVVTTTTTEYDSGLTFETVTVGEDNKIDMKDKCCLVATIKGPSNYSISGGVYYGKVKDEFKDEHTDSATNLLTKVFKIRDEASCNFQIHWYSDTETTEKTAPVHFASYYVGDASLNGTVNGSDVRAIVNYAIGSADDEVKNIVCDYDDSGEVMLADAVALTKAMLAGEI